MSEGQYWDGDAALAPAYREAHKLRRRMRNEELWLQGAYIYEALLCASPALRTNLSKHPPKVQPYREEPFALFEKRTNAQREKEQTQEEKNDARAKAVFEVWMVNVNERMKKKGGGSDGGKR